MSNNSPIDEGNLPGRISRKRARTRAELLAAARKVFAVHGFHEASIAEITAQADVGVGTFYLHFRDKDEIFATLLEDGLSEMREVVVSAVDDLAHLPYLGWTINEAWRMMPPAWIISRQAIDAFDLEGYHFPAGTVVMLSQWVIHNLPDIWGDPEVFRPERWQPEEAQKIPQGAFFPFGMGPRICIGMPFAEMETRLLLATILQQYTPELVPGFPVVPLPRVTLRPKYGMKMRLEPATKLASLTIS